MKKTLMVIFVAGLSFCIQAGDFSVQLISPPHRILNDELPVEFKVTVSNGTPSAIRLYKSAGRALEKQVFFGIGNQRQMDFGIQGKYFRKANVGVLRDLDSGPFDNTRLLNPGETHIWDFTGIFFSPFPDIAQRLEVDQMDIYAQVLVGTGRYSYSWAYSSTNTVCFSELSSKDGTLLFTTPPVPSLFGPISYEVREITTDGERFLFCGITRICKLTNSVTPSFSVVSTNSEILNISFGGTPPSILYDIRRGKIIP